MAEEKCDFPHTSLPRSCAKSNLILRGGLEDTSPHNPTIVVNETDSQPRRKQGYTGGSHGLTVSNVCSPCESSDDAQKHTLHQPTSSRSSIDSGVGGLSRTSSSGSVKRPSGEGPTLTYKPGSALVNKEPVLTEEDKTSYDGDGYSCILGISPGSDIIKVDDTRVSSTTSEVDDLVRKTESLSVSQKAGMSEREGKGSLYTREPGQTPHDSHTTEVSSTTDAESSWTERKERVSISKEAIDNLMIAAKEIFNDVQHQSRSKNLTSDSHTESDGPFRIAVRRHSTADPYIPLTQHSRQSERTRKRSVQPFFHHLVPNSDEDEGGTFLKRRKKSACIMCERKHNNETAESSTSVIIRRATAPLDCQKVRRYSEVLKTYKPSEIPFTEVRLLKMDDLRQYHHNEAYRLRHKPMSTFEQLTRAAAIHSQLDTITDMQLQEVLENNMPTFLQCTDWSGIFAHLVSKRLLSSDCREILLCRLRTNTDKGNHFYGRVLPSMGRESKAYIKLFQCLEETKVEHCGHNTLFDILRNGLRSYYFDKYSQATVTMRQ